MPWRTRTVALKTLVLLSVVGLGSVSAPRAAAQTSDTTSRKGQPFFVRRDAGILGLGLVASIAITPFDPRIARWTQSAPVQGSSGRHDFVRRVTKVNETTLTLAGLAAYGVGRLTHGRTTADVALHTTEAIVLTSVMSQLIRGPLGRSRPSVTEDRNQYDFHFMKGFGNFTYRAYPSLHAATAYAAGAALVAEVREKHPGAVWYAAPLLYGAASLPGLSRMYLDQHWASDIVMGGVVGVLMGSKVVDYSHAHPRNRFDRALLGLSVTPNDRGGITVQSRREF